MRGLAADSVVLTLVRGDGDCRVVLTADCRCSSKPYSPARYYCTGSLGIYSRFKLQRFGLRTGFFFIFSFLPVFHLLRYFPKSVLSLSAFPASPSVFSVLRDLCSPSEEIPAFWGAEFGTHHWLSGWRCCSFGRCGFYPCCNLLLHFDIDYTELQRWWL